MEEIKFGMLGNVDSGKSSSTSVLIHNQLDDGKGLARKKILKYKHEINSGRTSSVSENYLKIPEKNKFITFVDLAGHEKYLKTTMYGLSGNYIDYAIIFIGANMGVSRMTQEHLILAITLKIPFLFVITKIDLAPEKILNETIENINKLVKKMGIQQNIPLLVKDDIIDNINFKKNYPIFMISNKEGIGINKLRNFILNLDSRFVWDSNSETHFVINQKYNVKGTGTVFSGKLIGGSIKKNDKLLLGPFYGKWINVIAKSIHDNFRTNIEELKAGDSGCIAIRTKNDLTKGKMRKGLILINKINRNAIRYFDADITILTRHSTTMRLGYSPMINCGTIVQIAKIVKIYEDEKEILRCGDKSKVKFMFVFRPEFISEGERFIFRDGRTKGFGKISKIYDNVND
jgi:small GTP-binding protein